MAELKIRLKVIKDHEDGKSTIAIACWPGISPATMDIPLRKESIMTETLKGCFTEGKGTNQYSRKTTWVETCNDLDKRPYVMYASTSALCPPLPEKISRGEPCLSNSL